MQNLLEELIQLLSKDDRLVSEGKLLKNKVIELALNMDAGLIKLLLKNESIKRHFFVDIDGILVFDKIKFQRFVSNKQFLPDSYTTFKNKIGLVNENGDYLSESKEVVLAWPYKDCVLEGGQTKEDQKRDEIFELVKFLVEIFIVAPIELFLMQHALRPYSLPVQPRCLQ